MFFFSCSFHPPTFISVLNNNFENPSNRRQSSSSEEDNSPTQMNNCRKFIDKAPLVKRLSNSLLRSGDEYRPLINDNNFSNASNYLSASTAQILSKNDNFIDDSVRDANEMIASKFGDSCRKSLTSVLLDNRRTKDYCDFDFKQSFLRETSSGNYLLLSFIFNILIVWIRIKRFHAKNKRAKKHKPTTK